ncbi:MAG: hypothetical protein QOG14_2554, partial [Mycobacterium sp.]|nr:hypothetical protein [Mycobacterium sp.]
LGDRQIAEAAHQTGSGAHQITLSFILTRLPTSRKIAIAPLMNLVLALVRRTLAASRTRLTTGIHFCGGASQRVMFLSAREPRSAIRRTRDIGGAEPPVRSRPARCAKARLGCLQPPR